MTRSSTALFSLLLLALPGTAPAQGAGEVIRLFGDVLRQIERQEHRAAPAAPPAYRPAAPSHSSGHVGRPAPQVRPAQAAGPSPAEVRQVQNRLNALGFPAGPADGVMGARTRSALVAFQRARGLSPDGRIGPETMAALGRGPAAAATAAAAPAATGAAAGIAGIYCSANGTLSIRNAGPDRIEFALAAWSTPFSCGHEGAAVRQGDAWRHRSNEHGSPCQIDFIPGDGVTLRTARDASCRASCGAGMAIDGLHFPAAGRIAAGPDAPGLSDLYEGGANPC